MCRGEACVLVLPARRLCAWFRGYCVRVLVGGGGQVTSYRVDWDTNSGVLEVQTLRTTTSTGPNEIQSFTTSATDVDEMQSVHTRATPVYEVRGR
jgi:hypothetical protein